MKDFRAKKLNLDAMMAFTLTDDQNSERKVYKALKENPSEYNIRRLLTQNKVGTNDKLARFVGIEAYKTAGGTVTTDLFKTEQFFDDATRLQKLAADKMKAIEEQLKAEGWNWVEVSLEDPYGYLPRNSGAFSRRRTQYRRQWPTNWRSWGRSSTRPKRNIRRSTPKIRGTTNWRQSATRSSVRLPNSKPRSRAMRSSIPSR